MTDKAFEHNMKCNMLAVFLTRKHIEDSNLPKFMAIDYLSAKERELKALKSREFNKLYSANGKPSNLLLWEGWNYEPLLPCKCFPGANCDSIGECGR